MNLSVIVPVGLLLAVVLTLGRLYHDSEMAALQACGFASYASFAAAGGIRRSHRRRPGLAHVRPGAGRRQGGAAVAPIGDQGGAVRAARRGALPFFQRRRRCGVLCRARGREGVLHNVFVRRETGGRIEVALADTATYSKAGAERHALRDAVQRSPLRRVCPVAATFGSSSFSEHGIPIVTPEQALSTDTIPTPSRRDCCSARAQRRTSPSSNFEPRARSWRWCSPWWPCP